MSEAPIFYWQERTRTLDACEEIDDAEKRIGLGYSGLSDRGSRQILPGPRKASVRMRYG